MLWDILFSDSYFLKDIQNFDIVYLKMKCVMDTLKVILEKGDVSQRGSEIH